MLGGLDNKPCGGKYGDIIQAIGNTPLVELRRLSPKPGVRIYAKLESYNPTGSVKDRVARSMIERAEENGLIAPGQTILEPTSGNTGISLAMICWRKGYPLKVVMPDNVTAERTQLLQMYGAEIVYSPGEQGSNGAVAMALEMAEADACYYMPYQYGNQANPDAHYNGTAVEILEELDEVTAFVAGLGTGGTLMGNARRLKEENPDTLIVAAEPLQGELVQGLRSLEDGYIPPIIDLSLLDRKIFVSNRDAVVWTKKLLEEEGLFVGVSTGAIASICVRVADELDEGNVVFVVPDDGWKYLSSGVYTKTVEQLEDEGVLEIAARSGSAGSTADGGVRRARLVVSSSSSSSSSRCTRERLLQLAHPAADASGRPPAACFGPRTSRATTRITISSSGPGARSNPSCRLLRSHARADQSGRPAPRAAPPGVAASQAMIEPSGWRRPGRERCREAAWRRPPRPRRLELEREAREGRAGCAAHDPSSRRARRRAGERPPSARSACSTPRTCSRSWSRSSSPSAGVDRVAPSAAS